MVNVGSPSQLSRSELKIQSLPSSAPNDLLPWLTCPELIVTGFYCLVLSHELHALSPRNESQHTAFNIVIAAAGLESGDDNGTACNQSVRSVNM